MARGAVTLLLFAVFLVPAPSGAAEWYLGAKAGVAYVDRSGVDDPSNLTVKLGRQWGIVAGDLGIEGEISRTSDEGSLGASKVEVDSEALYLAFRTAGPFYFIARGGVARTKLTIGSQSDSDTESSYGLGLGFGVGLFQIEAEYTQMRENDDIAVVSVGLQF